MTTYIYGLIDPTDHKIKYIGRTNHLYQRWQQHVEEIEPTVKGEWIKRLRAAGITPTLLILDQVEHGDVVDVENWWIEFGRRMGWPLTNSTSSQAHKYDLSKLLEPWEIAENGVYMRGLGTITGSFIVIGGHDEGAQWR
ncbi:MAG: hypothetical protein DCC55_30810 [Chloroflexi bacterium]|nr:MAG: hypothetical protein DCC55_30810 [Chloroflexota bacterium]